MDDHILNGSHGDFEKIGVGCVCEVAVDFSCWSSVESYELVHEVFARLLPACRVALEIGEPEFGDWALGNLGLEQIDLVEEQDEGGLLEPVRVGD